MVKGPTDLLAMDIRQALHHLGEITGQITTDDLLDNPPVGGQVSFQSSVLECEACPPFIFHYPNLITAECAFDYEVGMRT